MRSMSWDSSVPTAERGQGAAGLVVRVAGTRRYLPATSVIEVLRDARLIRVPGAIAAVRGLVNHRGRILTVADVIRVLELEGELVPTCEVVVVQSASRRFGLAVDAVIEL